MIDRIYDHINARSTMFVLIGFVLINIIFNFNGHLSELWHDRSLEGNVVGEIQASEWGTEIIYQRLKSFQNLYTPFDQYLYPIGIDIAGGSIGFAFWVGLFRPYLSIHQSFSMVVILNFLLSNIAMFLLLRTMKISKAISFIVALMYGYMTFIQPRIGGHPDFTTYYIVPIVYWSILKYFKEKTRNWKIIFALLTGILYAACLYLNIYYFLIISLSWMVLFLYYSLTNLKLTLVSIWKAKYYLCIAIISFLITLYPFIKGIADAMLFSLPPQPMGWAGAIEFSSDLFGFFIPSFYNYYYGTFISLLVKDLSFARNIFENFSYPGIVIILGLLYTAIALYRKKLGKVKSQLLPYLVSCAFFWLITMGPFLHVMGNWYLQLENNIRVVMPLPFAMLHYLPFLNNIRVPGRFAVGVIFFGYLVIAILLNEFLKNKSKRIIFYVFILLMGVFILDHRYVDRSFGTPNPVPNKIYDYIAQDPNETAVVMKIPFTVRDGLMYLGSMGHILSNEGQNVHNKPVIGGYAGRLPTYAFDYYRNNAYLGYLSVLFDPSYKTNGYLIMKSANYFPVLNFEESQRAVDFLNIKYVILEKPDQLFCNKLYFTSQLLEKLGFSAVLEDEGEILFIRPLSDTEFLDIDIGQLGDELMLALGWHDREDGYRWANSRSSVLLNLKTERRMTLEFEAGSFIKDQKVEIYLNKQKVGETLVTTEKSTHKMSLPKLTEGLNTVHFIFEESFSPSDHIENSQDNRELSAMFYHVTLNEI